VFLSIARDATVKYRLDVHAYALMPNHVHFMMTPATTGAIPKAMQAIGRRYVPSFNRRHQRTGGLFEGRYRSFLIDDEEYWMKCMRYIELNPVRAGLAMAAGGYRWTSYRAHAFGARDLLLIEHPIYLQLGDTSPKRCRTWQAFCAESTPRQLPDPLPQPEGVRTGSDPVTTLV
jgi:putative transposase